MPSSRSIVAALGLALAMAPCLAAASDAAPGAADGDGTPDRLLVLNKHDDTLMAFDLPDHAPAATIAVGDEPHEIAVTPDGTRAYVSNVGEGSISVIDLRRLTVVRALAPERLERPHGLAIGSAGRWLLATSEGSRRFHLFDTARDVLVRSVTSTEEGMHMLAASPRDDTVYVANRISGSLTVLDAERLTIRKVIPVGPGPEGIALTPDRKLLLVALRESGEVILMKPGSDRALARIPVGRSPIRIAVTPDGALAFVANRGSDDLSVIDLESRSLRATIPVGAAPGGLAIAPDGLRAYVCNNGSNNVSIVSIPGLRVAGTIETGAHPDGIAIAPGIAAPDQPAGRKGRRRSAEGSP
jgi:YVTN family beta-propeller protein